MPEDRDCYKVLMVPPIAKREEIKKAYKGLAKKYHPDLNPDSKESAEEKMKELVGAYDILMDSDKRFKYDRNRHFSIKTPPQLRTDKKKNPFEKETSLISTHKFNLLETIKGLFGGSKDKKDGNHLSKEMADSFAMGITYAANSDKAMLEMAMAEFDKVIKSYPDNVYAKYNMAIINYRLGEFDRALKIFNEILISQPDFSDARRMTILLRDD